MQAPSISLVVTVGPANPQLTTMAADFIIVFPSFKLRYRGYHTPRHPKGPWGHRVSEICKTPESNPVGLVIQPMFAEAS